MTKKGALLFLTVHRRFGKTSRFTSGNRYQLTETADQLGRLNRYAYDGEYHLIESTIFPDSATSISTGKTYYSNGQVQTWRDGRSVVTAL